MNSTLWKWVVYIAVTALLCLILVFLAAFSFRQSLVLACLIAWLFVSLAFDVSPKPQAAFSPHWVWAKPNWQQILTDFKLMRNAEDWTNLQGAIGGSPDVEKSDAVKGFFYSIVNHSPDGTKTLIYLDRHKAFTTRIDFHDYLNPVTSWDNAPWPASIEHLSRIGSFMRLGSDGYDLGIRVPIKWWEENKSLCPSVSRERNDHSCGTVDLTIAVLPYKEFGMYWEPVEWQAGYSDKLWAGIKEDRQKLGWTDTRSSDWESARFEPKIIAHRYFEVRHDSI